MFEYRKILVVGCSGAGKSTLARALSDKLNIPVVHLDKIWWLPDWKHISREKFDELLEKELTKDCWIMDGNYNRTFTARLKYADFCIFLDYPQDVCLNSAYERFIKFKGLTRPDITDGCVERFDAEFEEWIMSYGEKVRPVMLSALKNCGVPYKIFTSREQTDNWLNTLP